MTETLRENLSSIGEQVKQLNRKPSWLRMKASLSPKIEEVRQILSNCRLNTVCNEASCPNLGECFARGTATFMILGDTCTRNCAFCDIRHGKPRTIDSLEPMHLAQAVVQLGLQYVVITSVSRDDLEDGGASHFCACIREIRKQTPQTRIEILTPDFRQCQGQALDLFEAALPDVFNHNLETVPRLYKTIRPAASYSGSLQLIEAFKMRFLSVPTKSGLMLGLGETLDEIKETLKDLRRHGCDRLTLGQYLQPSPRHARVARYVPPEEFQQLKTFALEIGFAHVMSGPFVRSSYRAECDLP